MMEEFVNFGSRTYALVLLLLLVARGMDFLSTWVATPNMVLEGNPIAKRLGWKWGIPLNLVMCFGFAFWPLPAIVISTTSVLVAARNFQSAWLMRSLGEQVYREWHVERVQETNVTLYLFCLFAQTALTAGVGAAVIYFSAQGLDWAREPALLAIGLGIIAYALAVAFYTLLGIWRLRRSTIRKEQAEKQLAMEAALQQVRSADGVRSAECGMRSVESVRNEELERVVRSSRAADASKGTETKSHQPSARPAEDAPLIDFCADAQSTGK
jgi:hypothetical protein